ncbi:MAG: serine hydrolase [Ignavibacteriae bacterium]|nr:serine hydrolase [Ignavibacteriota bacterium]
MTFNYLLPALVLLPCVALGQSIPSYYRVDSTLSAALHEMVADLALDKDFDVGEDGIEQISLAVIDLNSTEPKLGGVNPTNFIYPASVYKMYVAAEVLHQVSEGKYGLTSAFVVRSPNDVDRSRELDWDPRPLLHDGDTVTVGYLLDLMITRSDNSAANCLIDLARRENINALMKEYNWIGSEVTRKFLKRKYEDSAYVSVRGTETCALHAADFMYRVYANQLVNPWVSMQMKSLLGRQLDTTKLSAGLPGDAMFYHKTGWFSYWTNDVGIVDDGRVRYVIACFIPVAEEQVRPRMHELARRVHALMRRSL